MTRPQPEGRCPKCDAAMTAERSASTPQETQPLRDALERLRKVRHSAMKHEPGMDGGRWIVPPGNGGVIGDAIDAVLAALRATPEPPREPVKDEPR